MDRCRLGAAASARRHMAGIDRRYARGQKCNKIGLRPLQVKGDLIIAIRGDFFEVAVPRPARVETKFLVRLAGKYPRMAYHHANGRHCAIERSTRCLLRLTTSRSQDRVP